MLSYIMFSKYSALFSVEFVQYCTVQCCLLFIAAMCLKVQSVVYFVFCIAVQWYAVLCTVALGSAVLCSVMLCSLLQCCAVLCSIVQYCVVLFNFCLQYCVVLCSIV